MGTAGLLAAGCATTPLERTETEATSAIARVEPAGSRAPAQPGGLTPLESAVVAELNFARTRPRDYAAKLEHVRTQFRGNLMERPGRPPVITEEGPEAMDEAIAFLRTVDPVPPLVPALGLSLGARDHVRDQGPRGTIGHVGGDSSTVGQRVGRHGKWIRMVGETISYGAETAEEIVMNLIVDDGVADRGHRLAIFEPEYGRVGVAFGHHERYGHMCVATFAAAYEESADARTNGGPP